MASAWCGHSAADLELSRREFFKASGAGALGLTLAGADGPMNLLNAVRVAAASAARSLGVLVVMNEEVHAARFVRKMHTHKTSAFASPAAGPLGWIAEDRVRIVLRPARRSLTVAWHAEPPFVPLIPIGFAMDRTAIEPFLLRPPAGAVATGEHSMAVRLELMDDAATLTDERIETAGSCLTSGSAAARPSPVSAP